MTLLWTVNYSLPCTLYQTHLSTKCPDFVPISFQSADCHTSLHTCSQFAHLLPSTVLNLASSHWSLPDCQCCVALSLNLLPNTDLPTRWPPVDMLLSCCFWRPAHCKPFWILSTLVSTSSHRPWTVRLRFDLSQKLAWSKGVLLQWNSNKQEVWGLHTHIQYDTLSYQIVCNSTKKQATYR